MDLERPWLAYYGNVPHSLDCPAVNMVEALMRMVERCPEAVA